MEAPAGVVSGEVRPSPSLAPSWMTLFNQDRYHALNVRAGDRVVHATAADDEGRTIGSLGGMLADGVLVSGWSAPFGGVDLARERETPANVARLVDSALERAATEGAHTLRVKLPPACYGESEGLIAFTLLNRGFVVERTELNQHIDLEPFHDAGAYIERLKSPARRALRKLLGPEFAFRAVESDHEWHRAYATLAANRAAKGRRLSLSREYVDRARAALGDGVRCYELFHDDRAIAAALVYRVREARDLVVAWGDGHHGLERSPMNLLAYRVVEASLADGARTLDLGISNGHEPDAHGALVPDAGLIQFKQSIGARIEPRLTLVRELARS